MSESEKAKKAARDAVLAQILSERTQEKSHSKFSGESSNDLDSSVVTVGNQGSNKDLSNFPVPSSSIAKSPLVQQRSINNSPITSPSFTISRLVEQSGRSTNNAPITSTGILISPFLRQSACSTNNTPTTSISFVMSPLVLQPSDETNNHENEEHLQGETDTENNSSLTASERQNFLSRNETYHENGGPAHITRRNHIPVKNRNRYDECRRCMDLPQSPAVKRSLKPLENGKVLV